MPTAGFGSFDQNEPKNFMPVAGVEVFVLMPVAGVRNFQSK